MKKMIFGLMTLLALVAFSTTTAMACDKGCNCTKCDVKIEKCDCKKDDANCACDKKAIKCDGKCDADKKEKSAKCNCVK